ncbi:MAG: S-layer homology domain-containing protein [Clostridia bacterium]|nr:S-layer homology domain-containing protein [Clostridia bacterium]
MKRTLLLALVVCLLTFGLAAAAGATDSDNQSAKAADAQAVCQAASAAQWQNPYHDLKQEGWYFSAVEYVCQKGLMRGISATEFAPQGLINRAQAAVIFYRAAGEPKALEQAAAGDLQQTELDAKAITWAVGEGLLIPDENGNLNADLALTREMMAVMMFAYQKIEFVTMEYNLLRFVDADQVSPSASTAVNFYVGRGALSGYTDDSLRPQSPLTRVEAASFIHRCFK